MVTAIRTSVCAGLISLVILLVPGIAMGDMGATVKQELDEFDAELHDPGYTHFGRGIIDRGLEGYDALRKNAQLASGKAGKPAGKLGVSPAGVGSGVVR